MDFDRYKKLLSWLVFAITFCVYALTAQQSVMLWDSGEFIASAYKLQATHPPGAPLYSMLCRLFLLPFPATSVAFGASLFSALCGAFTVFFLFHAITWLGKKLVRQTQLEQEGSTPMILSAAFIGSLSLTFSDSFWVSSTEAEVYTLSTLFMALAFWAVSKWEEQSIHPISSRWLLLIAYLLGLSIGVHILNLAILFPVIAIVVLKKKGLSIKSVLITLGSALALFVLSNSILVQTVLKTLIQVELIAINSWGLPQHAGAIIGIFLFLALLFFGIHRARAKKKTLLEFSLLSILVFSFGWSTYTMAVLRTSAQTPTSNNASNIVRLLDYIQSDQFGFSDMPLIKGPSFNSPRDGRDEYNDVSPTYTYQEEQEKYVVTNDGKNAVPNYVESTKMLFPRMWNNEPINKNGYREWIDFQGKATPIKIVKDGKKQALVLPTMGENLDFFFTYQLGWLNFRYLMWNFVGRQNDVKGTGHPGAGNWVSGIPFIDSGRIGSPDNTPTYYNNHEAKNELYFLPLILGLLGIFFMFKNGKAELIVLALFFFSFGVAITIFINQLPVHVQIRERDYIFLGAYYAFCIWIGMGALGLFHLLKVKIASKAKLIAVSLACLLLVPGLMAFKNWKDHDRSLDQQARTVALSILNQCEPNAILFVSGDNITFPLWYMQEVEEYRSDVRVIDYNLLGLDWYTKRLKQKMNDAPALSMSLSDGFLEREQRNQYSYQKAANITKNVELGKLLNYVQSTKAEIVIPTDLFQLKVPAKLPLFNEIDPSKYNAQFVSEINWQLTKTKYSIRDIVMFDLLHSNQFKRPVYFSNTGKSSFNVGLENYFLNRGMVNQFLPMTVQDNKPIEAFTDPEMIEQLITEQLKFDHFQRQDQFISSANLQFAKSIYRKLFHSLALHHSLNGDHQKAIAVLDDLQAKIPNERVLYGELMYKVAGLYFAAGNKEEWRNVCRTAFDNLAEKISWYTSFTPQHEIITYYEVNRTAQSLTFIISDIAKYDEALAQELDPILRKMDDKYRNWVKSNPVVLKIHRNAQRKNRQAKN